MWSRIKKIHVICMYLISHWIIEDSTTKTSNHHLKGLKTVIFSYLFYLYFSKYSILYHVLWYFFCTHIHAQSAICHKNSRTDVIRRFTNVLKWTPWDSVAQFFYITDLQQPWQWDITKTHVKTCLQIACHISC